MHPEIVPIGSKTRRCASDLRSSLLGVVGGVLVAATGFAAQAEPSRPSVQGVVAAGKERSEAGASPATEDKAARSDKSAVVSDDKTPAQTGRSAKDKPDQSAQPKPAAARSDTTARKPTAVNPPGSKSVQDEAGRRALVIDGAATAAPVDDVPKKPEIEVRVSPSQRLENAYRNAVNALGEGRTAEGTAQLQQILQEHPGQDNARQILIGLAIRAKQFARAEALADERLAHGDEHLGFAVVSARLKLDRGELAEALDVLKRSEAYARSNADYQGLMAVVLQRLSRHAEAAERFRAALALRPGTGIWQLGLGISLQALERPAEAVEAFKHAREANGLSPELLAFIDERVAELQR